MRPERRGEASPSFLLLESLGAPGDSIALPEQEAHYVARVCRARAGERLTATDGRGGVAQLELLEVAREVRARIESLERHERGREATIWCGAPEGERADWLIEKLAELGVTRFQPLDTERATWRPAASRAERWRRLAAAALRQSRQCWSMEILPPRSLRELARCTHRRAVPVARRTRGRASAVSADPGKSGGIDRSSPGLQRRRARLAHRARLSAYLLGQRTLEE